MSRYSEKVKLKRCDLEVTRLSLGTAPLAGLYKAVSETDGEDLLNAALELGINYFDTAPMYGHGVAEKRVGAVLSKTNKPFIIETKVGRILEKVENAELYPWFPDAPRDVLPKFDYSADGIKRSLEESLERMGLDHIDIVLMHDAEDHVSEAIEIAFPVLENYRSQGIVKAVGIGINYVDPALQIMKGTDLDIALIAGRYTLLDQVAARELFPYALAHNIDITMGGVLNSGVLANPVKGATYNYLPASDDVVERAQKINQFLSKRNISILSAALQFPLTHPAVTSVLSGPRNVTELSENITAFNEELPRDIWRELEEAQLIERVLA